MDALRLDRSLVRGAAGSPAGRTVVAHLLRVGRDLGLVTAADGVDTPRQAAILRDLGCRHAQGPLFAGPLDDRRLHRVLLRSRFPVPVPALPEPSAVPGPSALPPVSGGAVPAAVQEGRGERRR